MSRSNSARNQLVPADLRVRDNILHRIHEEIEFLTPMFGGGVRLNTEASHHKEYDRVTPVRGSAVRGALRMWWRRTCAMDLDRDAMRAREEILWGWAREEGKTGKGWVSIAVDAHDLKPSPKPVFDGQKPLAGYGTPLAYGAFPLQPAAQASNKAAGTLTEWKGTFTLTLEAAPFTKPYRSAAARAYPEVDPDGLQSHLWSEVENAWLAFVNFGGLGGRTRRGFGAIALKNPTMSVDKVLNLLGWKDRHELIGSYSEANKAHEAALGKLQAFRQGKNIGRNPGADPKKPGRSRWPEPDQIRRITKRNAPQHKPEHPVHAFPRAAFGLPIIFHFKDRDEPSDTSLQPRGAERFASPLVLRPVRDGGPFRALALVLPSEELGAVLKRLELKNLSEVRGDLQKGEADQIKPISDNRPSRPPSGSPALDAFLTFFSKN